jgi:hypothetical protein
MHFGFLLCQMYVLFAALAAAAGFHPSATSLTIVDVCPFSPLRQHRLLFLSGQVPNGHIFPSILLPLKKKRPKIVQNYYGESQKMP